MSKELRRIDVGDNPDLLRLAEEVEASGQGRLLRGRGRDLAVLMPLQGSEPEATAKPGAKAPRRRRKTGIITRDDPFWGLVGIGDSGLGDVSANKHKYLAEAYAPKPE
jgi:hypothetical protein